MGFLYLFIERLSEVKLMKAIVCVLFFDGMEGFFTRFVLFILIYIYNSFGKKVLYFLKASLSFYALFGL